MTDATPQEVFDLALKQFHDRLTSEDEQVPAHVLGTTLATLARVTEHSKEHELPPDGSADPLDSLESLPPARRRELLQNEIKRLRAQALDYERRLEDLNGEEPA